jgi:ABC-2 type transport system permease protein
MRPKRGLDIDLHQNPMPAGACLSIGPPMARPCSANLAVRIEFNPNIATAWFTSVMSIINNVTMLAIILPGAALIREREHGTMDHLLVMPLTGFEIAMAKVWANGLVITIAVGLSLYGVVRMFMLVYLPMNMLSGSNTPLESMPPWLATAMQASPSTHFVSLRRRSFIAAPAST